MTILEGQFKAESTTILSTGEKPHTEGGKEILAIMQTFERIEQKNRCARVRFLDWLSAKLLSWSISVKAKSDSIDSPCFIKLKETK